MARTAPTVNGTPSYKHVSFHFLDSTGDKSTVSIDTVVADATDAKIEAMAAALGAASNAVLYRVENNAIYNSVEDASNAADTGGRSLSVFDHVVIQLKNTTNVSKRVSIPAPIEAVMSNGDNIDGASTELAAVLTAALGMTAAGSFVVVGARYNEKSEINEQIKI